MNFENNMLSDRSQTQKATCGVMLHGSAQENIRSQQIPTDKTDVPGEDTNGAWRFNGYRASWLWGGAGRMKSSKCFIMKEEIMTAGV
jgi:hypothetical protein